MGCRKGVSVRVVEDRPFRCRTSSAVPVDTQRQPDAVGVPQRQPDAVGVGAAVAQWPWPLELTYLAFLLALAAVLLAIGWRATQPRSVV